MIEFGLFAGLYQNTPLSIEINSLFTK